ncbi:hypothetical protein Tco_0936755 [Tanacetum coccineum]|uniref:Uncharacterized protein n=1 Tax=Tanacetum coccineum TaxID=301880 RepID=A0ABQ5DCA4_9ASTR
MFEFSSCLLVDSAINLVNDSSRLGLRSGYEEFPLFHWWNPGPAALYCPTGLLNTGTPYSVLRIRHIGWKNRYVV